MTEIMCGASMMRWTKYMKHFNIWTGEIQKVGGFLAALLYWTVLALGVVFSINPSHQEKHYYNSSVSSVDFVLD